jgi:hypothetical protein
MMLLCSFWVEVCAGTLRIVLADHAQAGHAVVQVTPQVTLLEQGTADNRKVKRT